MPTAAQLPPFLATALGDPTSEGSGSTVVAAAVVEEALEEEQDGEPAKPLSSSSPLSSLSFRDTATASVATTTAPTLSSSSTTIVKPAPLSSTPSTAAAAVSLTLADPAPALPTLLVPPLNFDMVCATRQSTNGLEGGAIYRSGFPNERNTPFLATLRLRTVVYLSSDDVRPNLQRWIDASQGRTKLLHFRLNVNKEPFAEMDRAIVAQALAAILDRRNMPLLMHCNKGKYRVGVLTALIRRLQGWSMTSIYEEYARFAGNDRIADEEFIDMFPLHSVAYDPRHTPDWLRM